MMVMTEGRGVRAAGGPCGMFQPAVFSWCEPSMRWVVTVVCAGSSAAPTGAVMYYIVQEY